MITKHEFTAGRFDWTIEVDTTARKARLVTPGGELFQWRSESEHARSGRDAHQEAARLLRELDQPKPTYTRTPIVDLSSDQCEVTIAPARFSVSPEYGTDPETLRELHGLIGEALRLYDAESNNGGES